MYLAFSLFFTLKLHKFHFSCFALFSLFSSLAILNADWVIVVYADWMIFYDVVLIGWLGILGTVGLVMMESSVLD
jgi:hypothetical protein